MKTFGIALFACVSLALASGCGDDDDGGGKNNDGGGKEGCYLTDENVCETYSEAALLGFCESLGGTKRACPTDNIDGVCVVKEEGLTTTRHYYKGSAGSAWEDEFGDSAAEDCEFLDGTYSAR